MIPKNFRNNSGNVILMVVILTVLSLVFFNILVSYSLKNLGQIQNLQNTSIAYYAAEGAVEKTIVEYFSQDNEVSPTIEDEENICTKLAMDIGAYVVDFFDCLGDENIGTLKRKATRYAEKITGFIDRYSVAEYWFTDGENETDNTIQDLKKIQITWNDNENFEENAEIEIVLVRWPKNNPKDARSSRVYLNSSDNVYIIEDWGEATDRRSSNDLNTTFFNYILFIKTKDEPTHFILQGLDRDRNIVELPDKVLNIYVKATLEDKRDENNTITRSLFVQKEIYSDYDSNFDYMKHLID